MSVAILPARRLRDTSAADGCTDPALAVPAAPRLAEPTRQPPARAVRACPAPGGARDQLIEGRATANPRRQPSASLAATAVPYTPQSPRPAKERLDQTSSPCVPANPSIQQVVVEAEARSTEWRSDRRTDVARDSWARSPSEEE